MKPFEMIPAAELTRDQINVFAPALAELTASSEMHAQLKLRDMGGVIDDLRSPRSARRSLAGAQEAMAGAPADLHRDIYIVTQDGDTVGMASRMTAPLKRHGLFSPAAQLSEEHQAELGSHIAAWIDPTRRYPDSAAALGGLYRRLRTESALQGVAVPVWTIEPRRAIIKGVGRGFMLSRAMYDAEMHQNNITTEPAHYASAYSKGLLPVNHLLFHSAAKETLSFDPAAFNIA